MRSHSLAGVMALKCAYAINHKLLRLHLDVMKRSNNDELMLELLTEIEQFSVRNLEAHKRAELTPPVAEEEEDVVSQEQADYELALKLQQEEHEKCAGNHVTPVKEERRSKEERPRALPIISPPMASPDPTKTFGFFSGHYIKLKQRWDESVGPYLNRADVSLAASPGNTDYAHEEDDEQFVDAVEVQSSRSSSTDSSPLDSPTSPSVFASPPEHVLNSVHVLESTRVRALEDSARSHSPPPLGSPLPGEIAFFDTALSDLSPSTDSSHSGPLSSDELSSPNSVNHDSSYSDAPSSERHNDSTNYSSDYVPSSDNYSDYSPVDYSAHDADFAGAFDAPSQYISRTDADKIECGSEACSDENELPPVYYTGH